MKQLLVLSLVLVSVLMLTSCDKDDDSSGASTDGNLAVTW